MEDARTSVLRLFTSLDARFKSAGGAGVPTGIAAIDKAGGLGAGELFVLAGHPGVGKTSLAISIACRAAQPANSAALWFSLAETAVQTIERFHLHPSDERLGARVANGQFAAPGHDGPHACGGHAQ